MEKGNFLKFTAFFFGGAILAIAVFMVYEKFFKKKEVLPPLPTTPPNYDLLLKVGVVAPKEISILQSYLNEKAGKTTPPSTLPKLVIDGIFGEKTRERLFEFMKKNETTLQNLIKYGAINQAPVVANVQLPPKGVV